MTKDKVFIGTYTGKKVNPFYPDEDSINLDDIAHALSMQCRFNGHISEFYSVAEHSIKVSEVIEDLGGSPQLQMHGLLHDASEAYICDVPKPFKDYLDEYLAVEEVLQRAIEYVLIPEGCKLTEGEQSILNVVDSEMALQESKEFKGPLDWRGNSIHIYFKIPLTPKEAKKAYIDRYVELEKVLFNG